MIWEIVPAQYWDLQWFVKVTQNLYTLLVEYLQLKFEGGVSKQKVLSQSPRSEIGLMRQETARRGVAGNCRLLGRRIIFDTPD